MDWLSPLKSIFEWALPVLDKAPFIRAALGTVLVFFLPGFAWTLVFFRQLKPLERIPISIALSIVLVTLGLIFASRLFGAAINGLNALLTILLMTILPLAIFYLNRYIKKRRGSPQRENRPDD